VNDDPILHVRVDWRKAKGLPSLVSASLEEVGFSLLPIGATDGEVIIFTPTGAERAMPLDVAVQQLCQYGGTVTLWHLDADRDAGLLSFVPDSAITLTATMLEGGDSRSLARCLDLWLLLCRGAAATCGFSVTETELEHLILQLRSWSIVDEHLERLLANGDVTLAGWIGRRFRDAELTVSRFREKGVGIVEYPEGWLAASDAASRLFASSVTL
jgi:hypothetical protein